MAIKQHGAILPGNRTPVDPDGRGIHTIEGFSEVANHTLRLAIVQTSADRGRAIRQTGGTGPGWYLALGTTGQWMFIGDVSASELTAAITAHNADAGAHSGLSAVDGSRPFTAPVGGVYPVGPTDLATKESADDAAANSELNANNYTDTKFQAASDDLLAHNNDPTAHKITGDAEVHWDLDNGDDQNTGAAGFPVQSTARVRELTDKYLMDGAHVRVIMDAVSASSYGLWNNVVIGDGLGRLSIEAADDTYEVVDAGPFTVTAVDSYAVNTQVSVSGAPWTANEHMSRWVRWLTGDLAGLPPTKVALNDTGTIDITSYAVPQVGDTFEIVDPGVLASGPGGATWEPLAIGNDAGSNSARLRVVGLRFPDAGVYAQGAVMFGTCKFDNYLAIKSHSSVSFYDYDLQAYLDVHAEEFYVDSHVQLWYGSITTAENPSIQSASNVFLEYLGWSAATLVGTLYWGASLTLGSWYGRGAGGFLVDDGAQLNCVPGPGKNFVDVQSTGATPLHVRQGGRVVMTQSGSTATSFPIVRRLTGGTSIHVERGGLLQLDAGRFCQGLGRGGVDTDIVVGARSLARSALYDGANHTRAARVLEPDGAEIRQVAGDAANNQLRGLAPSLPTNSSPAASDLVVTANPTTGLESATPVSALGLTSSQVMALNAFSPW